MDISKNMAATIKGDEIRSQYNLYVAGTGITIADIFCLFNTKETVGEFPHKRISYDNNNKVLKYDRDVFDGTEGVIVAQLEASKVMGVGSKVKKAFLPKTVIQLQNILNDKIPVLDKDLINTIRDTFDYIEANGYSSYKLNQKDVVMSFLRQNIGKRVFILGR